MDPDTLVARRVTPRGEIPQAGGDAVLQCLGVDHSGVLWLGSNAGGLRSADLSARGFSLYRQRSDEVPGLDSGFLRAICRARDGLIWVGTPLGLNRVDRSQPGLVCSSTSSDGFVRLPHPNVQALCEDRRGNLWIGTGGGVAAVAPTSGRVEWQRADATRPGSLSDDYVQVIHEDPEGRLWFGTLGKGVDEFDPQTRRFRNHPANPDDPARLPNGTVNALFSDRRGRLWVGTDGGLARLESAASGERPFRRLAALGESRVMTIGESSATPDVLWVGTAQDGLCRLDLAGGACRFYTHRNSELPDDMVYGILTDRRGRLWLSTNRGLVCFDPARETFRTYGIQRGLQSSEFNARAYFQAADGEMFFGGVAGLNSFYPEQIADNPHAPRVWVTGVSVADRGAQGPEAVATSIYRQGMPLPAARIKHRQRDLTFDFVALHYSDPAHNQYEYRLDGYDSDWHRPVTQRRVRYTNLDPGRYTFQVRALSSHGGRSERDAAFSFVVLPPFHATPWFRGAAGLSALGLLLGAYRWRVRHLHRRQQELETQVSHRTDQLRQALDKLQRALETVEGQAEKLKELDAAKSKFFANLSHEFRTPLMLTLGPLGDVRSGMHGAISTEAGAEIELALRNARRLLELVDQLHMLARFDAGELEFRPRELRLDEFLRRAVEPCQALASRQQIQLRLDLPHQPVWGTFDEGKLDQVIGNLLGNALKFTPAGGTVTLRLTTVPDGWATVEVEDTGPGIPAQDLPRLFERFYRGEQDNGSVPGTGLGLALARECTELHGGQVRAENCPGGGARFTVRLPLTSAPANS